MVPLCSEEEHTACYDPKSSPKDDSFSWYRGWASRVAPETTHKWRFQTCTPNLFPSFPAAGRSWPVPISLPHFLPTAGFLLQTLPLFPLSGAFPLPPPTPPSSGLCQAPSGQLFTPFPQHFYPKLHEGLSCISVSHLWSWFVAARQKQHESGERACLLPSVPPNLLSESLHQEWFVPATLPFLISNRKLVLAEVRCDGVQWCQMVIDGEDV